MLTLLLLVAVIVIVSAPLRAARRRCARAARRGADRRKRARGTPARERPRELEAAREAKYREIRDAELDFRTGKLSREDYEAIDGALRAEALEILNRLRRRRRELEVRARAQELAQGRLSSTIVFTKNRIAKKIVQRLRLRSTIEPPPSGPVPLPTPKAPDRPESLPECISTRKITITAIATWRTERIVSTPQIIVSRLR